LASTFGKNFGIFFRLLAITVGWAFPNLKNKQRSKGEEEGELSSRE